MPHQQRECPGRHSIEKMQCGWIKKDYFFNCWSYLKKRKRRITIDRYLCEPCGYVYDPDVGDPDNDIPAGTAFEDLPDDWVCPWCGLGKEVFVKEKD